MKKNICIFILIILISITFIAYADSEDYTDDSTSKMITEKAKVLEIISDANLEEIDINESFPTTCQMVKVKITSGKYKDQEFVVENYLSNDPYYDIYVEKGDYVTVVVEDSLQDSPNIHISGHVKDTYILYLLLIFIILLVLVGGFKGFKTVITLGITLLIVVKFTIPSIINGHSPVWISIISSIIITMITLFIISGINIKSFSTIIGTAIGVIIAGLLSYIIGSLANLTGLSGHESAMLMYIPQNTSFDFRGLLFAGIIIGTLGAVMDISMSIASSIYEIKELNPDISHRNLIKSGLNVGKDVMGTMTNTLILAYTGSSIPLLIIFMAYDTPMKEILNLDLIATELVRSLAGSIGIVLAIPVTAVVSGLFVKNKNKKSKLEH